MDWGLLDHKVKMVFKIPVGKMSAEDTEKYIRKILKESGRDFLMEETKKKLDKITERINNENGSHNS